MAVYKIAKCPTCKYNRTESRPAPLGSWCPRCQSTVTKKVTRCPDCGEKMREMGPPCPHADARHPDSPTPLLYSEKWYVKAAGSPPRAVSAKKKDADAEEAKLKTNQAEGRSHLNRVPRTAWKKARERFEEWAEENLTPKGAAMYVGCMKRLSKSFGKLTLDKVTSDLVEIDYVKARRGEGVKDSTINREITTIKRMYAKCEEWGLVESGEMRKVKKLDEPDPAERFYSQEEIDAILAECTPAPDRAGNAKRSDRAKNPMLRTIVVLALNTGMRKKNCLEVKRSDMDFKRNEIRITVVKKRKDRRLTIPMTPELRAELWDYVTRNNVVDMHGYLFPSPHPKRKGQPMRVDANFGFEAALKRAGVKTVECPHCSHHGGAHHPKKEMPLCPACAIPMKWRREECFHTLRHSFASHFLVQMSESGGIDGALKILQEILAHSDLKTTMRYVHVVERHKTAAMQGFSLTPPK